MELNRKMRLLILSPNQIYRYNWTHQLFRNEFSKHCDTIYYGDGFSGYIANKPIPEVVKDIGNIDLIFTYGLKYTEPFLGLGEIFNIPKVHLAVDYFPNATSGTYERNHKLFERDKYDLYFGVVGDIVRNLEKNNVCKKAHLLPFSIDTNIYKKYKDDKIYDVFSVFTTKSDTYPNRDSVLRLVNSIRDLKVFTKKVNQNTYIKSINKSKVCITSNNKFKSLSIKYVEILSCGSFLLADKPEDFNELGYVDGKHLVLYNDLNDLKDKIYFYAVNNKIREKIANNGMKFVRRNHNNTTRVQQFIEIVKKFL